MDGSLPLALLLPTVAGLSTVLGGLLTVFLARPGERFMSVTMGFSAGVMLLVSFVELLQEGLQAVGSAWAYVAFFGGMGVMFLIDALIPHIHMGEQHDAWGEARACPLPQPARPGRHSHRHELRWHGDAQKGRLMKTGLLVALGIAVHNFPEGVTVFAGTMHDPTLGIAIAIAITLHNIPEGIAVSAPIYSATGSRSRALMWTALSGLAEPVGALLTAVVLLPFLNATVLGLTLAAVAGIMVFISLDELIPVACSFCEEHWSILGVISGMIVMALSLALLE